MSRVHDALRRAEQLGESSVTATPIPVLDTTEPEAADLKTAGARLSSADEPDIETPTRQRVSYLDVEAGSSSGNVQDIKFEGFLGRVKEIPFRVAPESHLIDLDRLHEMPGEEFRTLRTRLNHIQTQQSIHSVMVTSASPAEGKTFTAVNLAMAQAQLAESAVLLADFDLRRPVIHNLFQTDRAPGLSDYLLDGVPLENAIRRIGNTNLHFLAAGSPVKNPLELLNLRQVRTLIEALPRIFNWVIVDSPPLLFSADANLLSTLTDGTVMVVRIGATTYDNVIRAMQSLCENNVLGIVANGARASELYSKYTYYYSKPD